MNARRSALALRSATVGGLQEASKAIVRHRDSKRHVLRGEGKLGERRGSFPISLYFLGSAHADFLVPWSGTHVPGRLARGEFRVALGWLRLRRGP